MWKKNNDVFARKSEFAGYEILEHLSPTQLRAEFVSNYEIQLYGGMVIDRCGSILKDEQLAIEVYKFKVYTLHQAHPVNIISHDTDSFETKVKELELNISDVKL